MNLKLNKIHFCCHFGFVQKLSPQKQRAILKILEESGLVDEKFRELKIGNSKIHRGKDAAGGSRLEIGKEDEGLSISIYDDQMAFCFNKTKLFTLKEKDIYGFVLDAFNLIRPSDNFYGFILRGNGYLDVPAEKSFNEIFGIKQNSSLGRLNEIITNEDINFAKHPFKIDYRIRLARLKKSNREVIGLDYRLYPKNVKSGIPHTLLQDMLIEIQTEDFFRKMKESLTQGDLSE